MIELSEMRGKYAKVFDAGNGTRRLCSCIAPYHIKRGGAWVDMDSRLDGDGRTRAVPYEAELIPGKIGYRGADPRGKDIELEVTGFSAVDPIVRNTTRTVEGVECGGVSSVLYRDVAKDLDIEFVFLDDRVLALQHLKSANAPSTCVFRSKRDPLAQGTLITRGIDRGKRRTKVAALRAATGVANEDLITVDFTGEVEVRDPKTRRPKWSTDVKYPVIIDPTSTFDIAANADDGWATYFKNSTMTTSMANAGSQRAAIVWTETGAQKLKYGGWLRFTGITIMKGATINAATLRPYMVAYYSPCQVMFQLDSRAAPGNPANGVQGISPANTAGFVTHLVSDVYSGFTPTKGHFVQQSVDVTSLIQENVNSRIYVDGEFVIYGNKPSADYYYGDIYNRDWGTTKAATLVIDFTPFPSATFRADSYARQAAYSGSKVLTEASVASLLSDVNDAADAVTNLTFQHVNLMGGRNDDAAGS